MNGKHKNLLIWMPLIGFDMTLPDKGVSNLIERAGAIPSAVSVFLFHPDIVHEHNGVKEKRMLPPDNCSYYGSARNEERQRQPWSNLDVKCLVENLENSGCEPYLGIMGVSTNDARHREWISDHSELLTNIVNLEKNKSVTYSVHVLKRFRDGTYYEDYFAEKICEVLTDYGFAGLHVADNFCPQVQAGISVSDYSSDMVKQFIGHTGVALPDAILNEIDSDDDSAIIRRRNGIWNNLRREWIDFYTWRWEGFWLKICARLHSIGKKVMVNNAWCSEPFEAIYRYGIDYKRLVEAGVDYIIPETVPNGMILNDPIGNEAYRYYQYMSMSMFMSVYAPSCKYSCLLGVKDVTEEWDALHHVPTHLERDIYTLSSYYLYDNDGFRRCCDSLMVCLGDGIYKDEWTWLRERFDIGFSELPAKPLTPTLLWSDTAFQSLLPDYIQTRRPSAHKLCYELNKRGGIIHTIARTKQITKLRGALFVPNFDLFSPFEQEQILNYKNGPVICIASIMNGFSTDSIKSDICFADEDSRYKHCAFAMNIPSVDERKILSFLQQKDDTTDIEGDPFSAQDPARFRSDMVFRKVSEGFYSACVYLLQSCQLGITVNKALAMPLLMKDGRIRLYLLNDDRERYARAQVTSVRSIKSVINVSKYPVLPVKFPHDADDLITEQRHTFIGKVPPGGISIFDLVLEEEKL